MPKIAEIKVIDGSLWAKMDIDPVNKDDSMVTVWTPEEIKNHDYQMFMDLCRALYEAYTKGTI